MKRVLVVLLAIPLVSLAVESAERGWSGGVGGPFPADNWGRMFEAETDLDVAGEACTITDMGNYYEVVLDFSGHSHYEVGEAYGEALVAIAPDWEASWDTFWYQACGGDQESYDENIGQVELLLDAVPTDYRDEVEGMASVFGGGENDVMNDGLVSLNELYGLQMIWDVSQDSACSGLGVYGSRTGDSNPLFYHNLEALGDYPWFCNNHAVTFIKDGSSSVCLIGTFGMLSAFHGVNDGGLFAGATESKTGAPIDWDNAHTMFDHRYALETFSTLEEWADYGSDPSWVYVVNHNILLADIGGVQVLENNFSGSGGDMHRALRDEDSALNPGVTWDIDDAVGVVNSFVFLGNHDNHTGDPSNYARWQTLKDKLDEYGQVITFEEMKEIATYGPGYHASGFLMGFSIYQIVVFEPVSMTLEVYFRQPGVPDPVFDIIDLDYLDVELAYVGAEPEDGGILVGWSFEGEMPSGVRVLREVDGDISPLHADTLPGSARRYLDRDVEPGGSYVYWLEVTEADGTVSRFGPTEAVRIETEGLALSLSEPYPSPASDAVTLAFTLPDTGPVELTVYDLAGRRVATVLNAETTAGRHEVSWSCGEIPSGVYLYRLETSAGSLTRRLVISR